MQPNSPAIDPVSPSLLADHPPAALRPNPRLFLSARFAEDLSSAARRDPRLDTVHDLIIRRADQLLASPVAQRTLVGQYPTMLHVARRSLHAVSYLAFAFLRTRRAAYRDHAERWMLAVAGFSDWNPTHFLDTAEIMAALAIGYDWLYPHLPESTRQTIRAALITKGLEPSFHYATEGPRDIAAGTWPVGDDNNWTQVCHAGAVLAGLAIADHEPQWAERIIERAARYLPASTAAIYGRAGSYPEGPMYWSYGTTFQVLLIEALRTARGDAGPLSPSEGFYRSADYQLHVTGPRGLYFNYSDSRENASIEPAMFWFARVLGRPDLLVHEWGKVRDAVEGDAASRDRLTNNRLLPFLAVWWPTDASDVLPPQRHWLAEGPNPVGVHRSGWGRTATFVGLKGGSPWQPHGHMDVGSFVLDAAGVRWAIDLGIQEYDTLGPGIWDRDQRSERWRVFRLNNTSHSTLIVDDEPQRVTATAVVTSFSDEGPEPHTEFDLTPVIGGTLTCARRRVTLVGEAVTLEDRVEAGDAEARVRWTMMTRAEVEIVNSQRVRLTQAGRAIQLAIDASLPCEVTVEECEPPPAAYDAPNPGVRRLVIASRLPAYASSRLRVTFQP